MYTQQVSEESERCGRIEMEGGKILHTIQRECLGAIMFGEIDLIKVLAKKFGELVYNPLAI